MKIDMRGRGFSAAGGRTPRMGGLHMQSTTAENSRQVGPGVQVVGFLIGTVVLFSVLTAVMTYPQALHMRDAVSDVGDPFLNLWALSWVAHQLPAAPAHLF